MRRIMLALVLCLVASTAQAQQPDPFGGRPIDTHRSPEAVGSDSEPPLVGGVDARLESMDSAVYRLASESRLQVRTGKSGLLGFAGHTHVIQARGFHGEVVYYPRNPSSSRLDITVVTDSLEVLTPPDTAEIRKVTETMRTRVLRTAEYPEIKLVSRKVTPTPDGFRILAAMTMAGRTQELPIDIVARIGVDTLEAASTFSVKQTDFGITPVSAGPGGAVKVADRVTFDIRAVAVRLPAAALSAKE
jgi:polyisoprenoid-binding protein YceI